MVSIINNCQGSCLRQTGFDGRDWIKEKECEFDCKPLKCPNFDVCKQLLPEAFFGCYGGRCYDCNLYLGRNLEHGGSTEECPVCLEEAFLYKLDCNHICCAFCIHKLFFPSLQPYHYRVNNRVEDEVDNDNENDDHEVQSENEEDSEEEEESEVKCPLCRKLQVPPWRKGMESL